MTSKSILIIGAGIGGLSTGCYARMNGYRTRILEMHSGPGGVCTSWTRGGYVFDGCIHNLAGSSPKSPLHRIWRELGVIPQRPMLAYEELVQVERPDGKPLRMFANLDRLQHHLRQTFPADLEPIDEMIEAARAFLDFDLLALSIASPRQRFEALRAAPLLLKWGTITLQQFAERFSDPFLRSAFPTLVYDWPEQSMAVLLSFLAGLHKGDFGWAVGGSGAFARAVEQRFLNLGGEISYSSPVQKILVQDDHAVGVRLADGSEERADIVVSNAYGPTTLFGMLDGRYLSRTIRQHYAEPEDRIEMGVHVSLGVNRDLSDEPHAIVLPLDPPAVIGGEVRHRLYVEPFGFDVTMAPPGKSVLKVVMATSYKQWQDLHRLPELYRQEKQRIAESVIVLLEKRFPGLRSQIEMIDVATPMTTQRYTGNGQGFRSSMSGMALSLILGRHLSRTLPGLDSFYMVGQWAGQPGVPTTAAMGKDVARAICRRDGVRFVTSEPSAPPGQRRVTVEPMVAA